MNNRNTFSENRFGTAQTTRATPLDLPLHPNTAYISYSQLPEERDAPSQLNYYMHILYNIFFVFFTYILVMKKFILQMTL